MFFAAETVDSYELGLKTTLFNRSVLFNATYFDQRFENFQLNTFDGSVFIVQNINGCSSSLNNADRDGSIATGACAADDVGCGLTFRMGPGPVA